MHEPMVDAGAVAEVLGVTKEWVYDAAKDGRLPCYRAGRAVRFRLAEVEAALASGASVEAPELVAESA